MAADKKPTMTRADIEAALKAGQHVAIGGHHVSHRRDIPAHDPQAEGKPEADEFDALIVRTADGRLTRAGMENAIKQGGSVMHAGEVLTKVEDLPDEADLVRHDEAQRAALAKSYDDQMGALAAQKAKLEASAAAAPAAPAPAADETEEAHARRRTHKG